jgi:hypothetical protein
MGEVAGLHQMLAQPLLDRRLLMFARFRPSPAAVLACLALCTALGGTAVAAVIVSSNSQVAKNTIAGHKPPSGDHPNIISGSITSSDVAQNGLTGAAIDESTLGKVPSAANADKLGGSSASAFQHRISGNCTKGGGAIASVNSNGSVGCWYTVTSIDLPNLSPDSGSYTGTKDFSFGVECQNTSGMSTVSNLVFEDNSDYSLNWFLSNSTQNPVVSASGVNESGGTFYKIPFTGGRVEGQVIASDAHETVTFNIHAIDNVSSCEAQGTMLEGLNS